MSSPQSRPHPHFALGHGSFRYVISPENILLDVIAEVNEGWLQDIPWETLPLTKVFVKERLALSTFSTCLCTTHSGTSLGFSNIGSRLSLSIDDQSFIAENNSILGCHCSGWKDGAVGTLSCRSKKDRDSLLQELNTLKLILGGLFVEEQAQVFAGAIRALHSNFSRIEISPGQGRMAQANENVEIAKSQALIRNDGHWHYGQQRNCSGGQKYGGSGQLHFISDK